MNRIMISGASLYRRVVADCFRRPILTAFLVLVSGCAMGPDYKRPRVETPASFRGETPEGTNSFGELAWWNVFPDDGLQNLIRAAITNNYDLRIAVTRVEQARAIAAEARSGMFPQINYSAVAGRGKNVGPEGSVSPTGITGSVVGADVNASWEIDVWGRIRRLTEAARAQYFSTREAQREVRISLISEVARDYFQLLALDRELVIAQGTTNSFGESLRLFTRRLRGGVASKLETASAEALMDSTAATIPELERQIMLQENQITVLLGTNPGPVLRGDTRLENQTIPSVPAGLPSALLERRPDIREAEQQLRSANAQIGVAKADFFPQISLTALLGKVSTDLSGVTAGGATAWSVAAGLTGPLFQAGKLRAQYRQALAARDQFALQYQSAVLTALQEVSNALISREKLAATREYQTRAVAAYREALQTATKRYQLGSASYYEVLQQQQLLFPAENSLAQTQANQLVNTVQLYLALGGGWQR